MELFTGGREPFPQHISPFPDLTAMIESAEPSLLGNSRPNLPPQKLRPIRYNGRSPATSQLEHPSHFMEPADIVDYEVCAVKGDSGDCFEPPIKAEVADLVDTGCDGGGGGTEEEGQRSLEEGGELFCSSSSDSDDNDLSTTSNEPLNKKGKRKRREKIELFLEKLVMKVMKKQEQMHNQLIEMIEKREKERIAREEAWKRQEMERIKRDEEARAQETSRSLALIFFIQNVLGHEIEIPTQSTTSCMEENGGKDMSEDHNQNDMINLCDPISRRQEGTVPINEGETHVHQSGGINCDQNGKRWPDAEVQALIMLRSALEHKFRFMGSKCSIWDEISVKMYNMGYSRSAKKCKEKWENINKYFRKSIGSGTKHLKNSKRCAYFHELDMLYKNGLGTATSDIKHTKDENDDKGESLKGREGCQ